MPIRVPDELPAVSCLRNENVFVMTSSRASIQDIRPLKVLLLNLMPKKIETENQFLRLLSNSPLQIDIQLLFPKIHLLSILILFIVILPKLKNRILMA